METFFNQKQLAIVICLYIGQLTVGYIAWTAPVIAKLKDPDQTPLSRVITDSEGAWMGSFSFLGAIIGAAISGWVSNSRGRKPCLFLGGLITMACFLLLSASNEMWMITVGRCVNGIGLGIILITNLTYIAEIASTNIRGSLLAGTGVAGAVGVLIVYIVGPYVSYSMVMYTGLFIALVFTVGTLFIPETPVYHALKGKEIEAKATLLLVGRVHDFQDILTSKQSTKSMHDWKCVFSTRSNRRALMITLVLNVMQQSSGALSVMFYATAIFQSVDSSIDPAAATIVVGATQVLASIISPLLIERAGRRALMISSTATCSISLALLGVYFLLERMDHELVNKLHWIPLLTLVTFLISYQSGFGVISNACMSELFDSSARGPGSAIVFSASMVFGFLVTATFGYMMTNIGGHITFFLYSGACAFACIFSAIYMVETKGKTLSEVQHLLSK